MLRRTVLAAPAAWLLAAAGGLSGCLSGCRAEPASELRIMVPNAPGSGYDITARTVATALDTSGIHAGVEVFNLPGGGGMAGLQRMAYERGNTGLLMLMGLGLVGVQHASPAQYTLADLTPVARLIEEPEIVVVTSDSPMRSLADLMHAWTAAPSRLMVGGGSAPGGPDHLAPMLMAQAAGIPPTAVQYRQYDGGGALLAAVLSGQVSFAVSSLGEYAQQVGTGQLRVLAVTSGTPPPGLDAPTLRDAGVDVVFANWRGLMAPPGLAEASTQRLIAMMGQLHTSGHWSQAVASYQWSDTFLPGAGFAAFLAAETQRVKQVLRGLGLPG